MASLASSSTIARPTAFLGKKGSNANPLRDVVSMGNGKYIMVGLSLSSLVFFFWMGANIFKFILDRVMSCGMDLTE